MATVTKIFAQIFDGELDARLEVDYDDVPIGVELDHDLVAVRCVNNLARSVTVQIRRGNGANWLNVAVPAGTTRSQNAGGAVQQVGDLPIWQLRT